MDNIAHVYISETLIKNIKKEMKKKQKTRRKKHRIGQRRFLHRLLPYKII